MEVVVLNDKLFNKNQLQNNQISHNKNGSRPYYYSFERNNHRVCVPLRTNTKKVPERYKENLGAEQPNKPNSAVDLTKSIIVTNEEYINNKSKANVPPKVNKYLKQPEQQKSIERKFDVMVKDYIKAKAKLSTIPLTKISTIQYFHGELDLDTKIDNQKFKNTINEIADYGQTEKYHNLKNNLNHENKDRLEKYEDLNEFSELCKYDSHIDKNSDINNPRLIINKDNKQFSLTATNLQNEPDKYVNDFLDFKPKNDRNNDLDL